MRNQIKKMIKKENGFTLVELLAVLVILGVIVAIAIPAIGNVVENAKGSASDAETELVIDAARLYDIENGIDPSGVSVLDLKKAGFLEDRNSETLKDDMRVKVSNDGDKGKTYQIVE